MSITRTKTHTSEFDSNEMYERKKMIKVWIFLSLDRIFHWKHLNVVFFGASFVFFSMWSPKKDLWSTNKLERRRTVRFYLYFRLFSYSLSFLLLSILHTSIFSRTRKKRLSVIVSSKEEKKYRIALILLIAKWWIYLLSLCNTHTQKPQSQSNYQYIQPCVIFTVMWLIQIYWMFDVNQR